MLRLIFRSISPIRALFAAQLVFSVIFCFANLFMNIFLWDLGQSFRGIGIFNMFSVVSIFLASLAGAFLLQRFGTRVTFICSSLAALILFIYLFAAPRTLSDLLPVLGGLYGAFVGLFYIGFNLHLIWLSKDANRNFYVGLESAVGTLAQLLTPICAGLFIANYGYPTAFGVILFLLLLQVGLSTRIPFLTMTRGYNKRYFFLAENEEMARMGFSSAAYGFYFSFIQMSYGLFFYFFLKNEFHLGSWNFVFGGISTVMYWIVGRRLKQTNRDIFLSLGMLSSIIITLSLLMSESIWFILFNLVVSVSLPLLWIPSKALHYAQIRQIADSHLQDSLGKMMQMLVFREFSISLGRIAFFLIMVIGFDFQLGVSYYVMVILAVFMPVGIWVLNKNER